MKTPGSSPFIAVAAIFLLSIQSTPSQTNTIVVPREAEAAFGNDLEDPLFRSYFEQIYPAAEFSDLPVNAILITGIAFRIDEAEQRFTNFAGGVLLQLNVFRGSLLEIFERSSGRQEPIVTVFEKGNIVIPGRPAELAFDFRLHFRRPFLYDRRLGHLVLTIDSSAGRGVVDATRVFGHRGLNIYFLPHQGYILQSQMLVTEFSYLIPPTIGTIRKFPGHTQIIFSHSSAPDSLKIESAESVRGPFTEIPNVQFHPLSSSTMRANIPTSPGSQFFRIRQNLP